jgi:hypothetical protein
MQPVSRRYSRLTALTGLTPAALATLTTRVAAAQPAATGQPWPLTLPDRALLITAGLRTNPTTRAVAAVLNLSELRSCRWAGLDEIVIAVESLWHKVII